MHGNGQMRVVDDPSKYAMICAKMRRVCGCDHAEWKMISVMRPGIFHHGWQQPEGTENRGEAVRILSGTED
jgi:hypothetical protein